LYGENWAASIPILQVLVFTGVFSCIDFIAPTVLLAQGRANFSFALSVVRTITLLGFIWLASPSGIVAVAAAVSAHAAIMLIISFALIHRLTQFGLVRLLKAILPAAAASLVMVLAAQLVRGHLVFQNAAPMILLLAQAAVGCVVYGAVIVVWPSEEIRSMARSIQLRVGFLRDSKLVDGLMLKWDNLGRRPAIR
jgi:PST family polysaccharide transporter